MYECEFIGDATYSPDDNKLRLYAYERLSEDDYQRVKAAGFKWAPKQELFVAPRWTPDREDLLLELCGEIGDEDISKEERAADRAERFGGYRDKRRAEANGHADTFEAGPSAFGNQNAQRAQRQAAKHDRHRTHAVSQWSKAEYWQQRTESVIRHALHKASPRVRRGRILRLEAEHRKHENAYKPDPDTTPIMQDKRDGEGRELHYWIKNGSRGGWWCGESTIEAAKASPTRQRWTDHYKMRLTYERAMLENEGGTAGDVEMEPGGHFGGMLIVKVNKSSTTGAVVSVNVHSPDDGRWDYRRRGDTLRLNVQRSGEKAYTPPTPDSLAQLAEIVGKAKTKTKARNAGKPKLINPTNEDAERLQDELNRLAYERRRNGDGKYITSEEMRPTPVAYMTQAEYSERSKGTYARFETQNLHAGAELNCGRYINSPKSPVVCKIRTGPRAEFTQPTGTNGMRRIVGHTEAASVVVITDKPQKPLPDWTPRPADNADKTESQKVTA